MSLALGVLAFIAGLAALIATAHLFVNLARDWAEDRRREQVLPTVAEWVIDSINNGVVLAHRLADELHEMHAAEAIDLDQWPTAREWLRAIGRSER